MYFLMVAASIFPPVKNSTDLIQSRNSWYDYYLVSGILLAGSIGNNEAVCFDSSIMILPAKGEDIWGYVMMFLCFVERNARY